MSTNLGRPRKPGSAMPGPISPQSINISSYLASVLGQYIPGYTFITELLRDKLGIDADKVLAVLGFFFGGWALFNYLQNVVLPRILSTFTSSLILERNDQSYEDFTSWISKRKIFQYARSIRIVGRLGEHKPMYQNPWSPFSRGETFLSKSLEQDYSYAEEQDESVLFDFAALEAKRPLLFEPHAGTYWFFYQRRLFLFSKNHDPLVNLSPNYHSRDHGASSTQTNSIRLTCIGLSTKPLKELMENARAENYEDQAFRTSIFRPGGMNRYERFSAGPSPWMKVASRPSRPLESVVLSHDQKEQILKDWNSFLHPRRQAWFSARGIPYRRGYLFSGPPGTGKTSICYALAGVFGVDVFVVALGDVSLSDAELTGLLTDLPTRCIVVLEDIDCVGAQRDEEQDEKDMMTGTGRYSNGRAMSLSGLLNAIDGVGAHEGHILVMTTNYPDVLDDALKRPGRIDMHVRFTRASRKQIQEIFVRMYSISDDKEGRSGRKRRNMTVDKACRESSELTSERSCPHMTNEELLTSAINFSGHFEEEEFSPAEIQGFLLMHKAEPFSALAEVTTWIPEQLAAREKAKADAEKSKERKAAKQAKLMARQAQTANALRSAQGLAPLLPEELGHPSVPVPSRPMSNPAKLAQATDTPHAEEGRQEGMEMDNSGLEVPSTKSAENQDRHGAADENALAAESPTNHATENVDENALAAESPADHTTELVEDPNKTENPTSE